MQYFSKISRFLIYVLFVIILIFLGAGIFADSLVKGFLEKKISEASGGKYLLELEEVDISLFRNMISFQGIQILTNTSHTPESMPFVEAKANDLSFSGMAFLSYFVTNKVVLDDIILDGLDLKLRIQKDEETSGKPFTPDALDIYPQIKDFAELIAVDDLLIQNSSLEFLSYGEKDSLHASIQNFSLHAEEFLLNKGELFTGSRTFYSGKVRMESGHFSLIISGPEKLEAAAEKILLRTRKDLTGLDLETVTFFQKERKGKDTLLYGMVTKLELTDFNFNKFQKKKIAVSQKALISGIQVKLPAFAKDAEDENKDGPPKAPKEILQFSLGALLPEYVEQLILKELEIREVNLQQGEMFSTEKAFLLAGDLDINHKPAFSDNRFFHAKKMEAGTGKLKLVAGGPKHIITLSDFRLVAEGGTGSVLIQDLRSGPLVQGQGGNRFTIFADHLRLNDFNTRGLPSGVLKADSLIISLPWGIVQLEEQAPEEKPESRHTGSPGKQQHGKTSPGFLSLFREAGINVIQVSNASFRAVMKKPGGVQEFSFQDLKLESHDLLFTEDKMFSDSRSFYSFLTNLEINDLQFQEKGTKLRQAATDVLSFRTRGELGFLSGRNFNFVELGNDKSDTLQYLKLGVLNLEAFNFNRFLKDKIVSLRKANFINPGYINNLPVQEEGSGMQEENTTPEQSVSGLDLGKYLPAFLEGAEIGKLEVLEAKVNQQNGLSAESINLSAAGIEIGKETAWNNNRFLHAKSFENNIRDLRFSFGDPGHKVNLGALHMKAVNGKGNLELQDLLVNPHEINLSTTWLEAEAEKIIFNEFYTGSLPSGTFIMDSLWLSPVKIVFHGQEEPREIDSVEETSAVPDLYPLIAEMLDTLIISAINIPEADIRLSGAGGSYYGLHFPEARLRLDDLLVSKGNAYLNGRVLHASDIRMEAAMGVFLFPDRTNFMVLDKTTLSTGEKSFSSEGIRLGFTSNYPEKLESGTGNTLYRVESGKLNANNVQWENLFRDRQLVAGEFTALNPYVYIYKDFNKPEPDVIKPMPYDMVHNIGFPVFIEKMVVRDLDLTYEEKAKGAVEAGLVDITNMEVLVKNFTNIKSRLVQKPEMEVSARGRLMNKGNFETTMTVPLLEENIPVVIIGSLDTIDMTELNRIARYNSGIAIETGMLYAVNWNFKAGNNYSKGDFEVSYKDFSVQLSDANSPDTTGILKKAGSFLANVLIIDSNIAEKKSEDPKKVQFEQKRDKKRSFFNFYVKSLLSGLIEAVGVPFR